MSNPRFSVIITTFNRPTALARGLAALARSDYQRSDFEVIVVDDGGSEPLEGIVAGFEAEMCVRLIRQSNGGPASGRNRGADAAKNEFLAFTDDDCEPAQNWLSALGRRLERSPDCLVGGRMVNGLTGNLYAVANQIIVDLVYAHYNSDPEQAQFFATSNLALRADLFQQCGGFDENLRITEDREFCNRWLHRGFRLAYVPEAVIEHRHPVTFGGFWRQHFGNGRAAVRFHRICAERSSGRLQDHFGIYAALPRYWRGAEGAQRWQFVRAVPLLALWRVANAAGFLYERLS